MVWASIILLRNIQPFHMHVYSWHCFQRQECAPILKVESYVVLEWQYKLYTLESVVSVLIKSSTGFRIYRTRPHVSPKGGKFSCCQCLTQIVVESACTKRLSVAVISFTFQRRRLVYFDCVMSGGVNAIPKSSAFQHAHTECSSMIQWSAMTIPRPYVANRFT